MLYWNNAYLYTVHTDLFNHKGSAQSTALQVALLAKQALNVKLVKAHWHECSIETMPAYILCIQTFSIIKDLLRALLCKSPCWRSKHWMSSLWRLTGMNARLKQCLPKYCAYRPFQQHVQGRLWQTTTQQLVVEARRRLTALVWFDLPVSSPSSFMACEASTVPVLLVSAAPALNARMRRQAKKRIGAMEIADTPELKSVPEWFEQKMLRNDTKFQAQTARANFCSFPIENIKGAQAQIETNSKVKLSKNMWLQTSDWHIPNSWAPDNRMKKRLMTKPRRGRTKEHGAIPANEPKSAKHKFVGKNKWRGKTQNPETKTAHQINHLMVASSRHE